jgi:hypothetical protein
MLEYSAPPGRFRELAAGRLEQYELDLSWQWPESWTAAAGTLALVRVGIGVSSGLVFHGCYA